MHARYGGPQAPAFLPLVVDAARAVAQGPAGPDRTSAQVVRRQAEVADAVASECWTALLAGCHTPARRSLAGRLRELTEATSIHLGPHCWFNVSSPHRTRVTDAQERITDAVREGDGEEFAAALAGYDQAIATAMASVRTRPAAGAQPAGRPVPPAAQPAGCPVPPAAQPAGRPNSPAPAAAHAAGRPVPADRIGPPAQPVPAESRPPAAPVPAAAVSTPNGPITPIPARAPASLAAAQTAPLAKITQTTPQRPEPGIRREEAR